MSTPIDLCGRDREWREVVTLLETATAGGGGVLVVDGPPGSCRSVLVREAVSAARAAGGTAVPDVVRPDDGLHEPDLVARALSLRAGVERGPLLVVVDDAHLAAEAIAALLPGLRARLAGSGVAMIVALDGSAAGPVVRRALVLHGATAGHLRLDPEDDGPALLARSLRALPGPDLLSLVTQVGGDEEVIAELVLGLREEGRLSVDGARAEAQGTHLPLRVRDLVRRRFEALSPKASQLVRVAAATGESFLLHDVATLMGETAAALLPAVDEALLSGVIVCTAERQRFRSTAVWRAVVDSIPEAVLTALRRDAGALCGTPVPVSADVRGATTAPARRTPVAPGCDGVHGHPVPDDRVTRDGSDVARLPVTVPAQTRRGAVERLSLLSDPERDVARLVGAGLTNRQVARRLFLSPHTVNYHLRGIFRKLGISSRVELARFSHGEAASIG
jgi:DNA-binding CsgD family transcriptional regulator